MVVVGGWRFFAARLIKSAITQGGTAVLGSQVDVASLSVHLFPPSVDVTGFAVADNEDLMRNRFAVGHTLIEVELLPLLEKKVIIKNVTVADVRAGAADASGGPNAHTGRFLTYFHRLFLAVVTKEVPTKVTGVPV